MVRLLALTLVATALLPLMLSAVAHAKVKKDAVQHLAQEIESVHKSFQSAKKKVSFTNEALLVAQHATTLVTTYSTKIHDVIEDAAPTGDNDLVHIEKFDVMKEDKHNLSGTAVAPLTEATITALETNLIKLAKPHEKTQEKDDHGEELLKLATSLYHELVVFSKAHKFDKTLKEHALFVNSLRKTHR
jgi:hypothetical protein